MDNPAAAAANKAHGSSSSFSPSKWVAGLLGRGQEQPTVSAAVAGDATVAAAAAVSAAVASTTTTAAAAAASAATTTFAAAAGSHLTTTITAPTCDWAAEKCYMASLPPIQCQREGCQKLVHHVCSIEWVSKNNLPEETIATLCRAHHPQYRQSLVPAAAATSTLIASPYVTAPSAVAAATAKLVVDSSAHSPDFALGGMTINSISSDKRGKSPIFSTANKINPKTATMKKVNKKGDLVDVVMKEARITKKMRVYSEREKLIKIVKQGDPQYDVINNAARAGFRFYGTVLGGDKKKGHWNVQYDLFPEAGKTLVITRRQCTTLRAGEDEPQFDPKHEKVDDATERLELLDSEPEEDYDLVLPDADNDNNDDDDGFDRKPKKPKKKKSRKVLSIDSFLNMSDAGVVSATSFNHFYGEGDGDFIEWTILKDGEEITTDVMQHKPQDGSPFGSEIEWHPQTSKVDYFHVFFTYFFPSLEGKAAVLDLYLSNSRCSGHETYWVQEKVRFHREDHSDPDFIVSIF